MSPISEQRPWSRLLVAAVLRNESSAAAVRGRALVDEDAVGPVDVAAGAFSATVACCAAAITAQTVPASVWKAITSFARGNERLQDAVDGVEQSVHLDHLMTEDWDEPLVPRAHQVGRNCACDGSGVCEHVAALAYAVADLIDEEPALFLRWRGCTPEAARIEEPLASAVEIDASDEDAWRAGPLPEPRPLRPLPVAAVLKRLGRSKLELRGEDLAVVLERAYVAFAESGENI
jgi:uncharacterized Zn finger protein